MATGDNIVLRVVGRYQDQNIVNSFHYNIENQVTGDQDILEKACVDWDTNFRSAWTAAHSTDYELIGIKGFRNGGTAKTPGHSTINAGGTRSGTPAPAFVCRTITLYSESAKHRRRGRCMLSGTITEDINSDDGSVKSAAIAVMNTLGALLIATFGPSDQYKPILPPAGADPEVDIVDYKSRITPSVVTSRRIKQFLIG